MLKNQNLKNFQIEDLEERLEMAQWVTVNYKTAYYSTEDGKIIEITTKTTTVKFLGETYTIEE